MGKYLRSKEILRPRIELEALNNKIKKTRNGK